MDLKTVYRFAIYSRKSKFTGKGESVENQIEMCRQYIAAHYGKNTALEARVYEDEGFSGGNLNRPQFQKMIKDSHESPINAVVVYRLDRISRNIGDFANLINDLSERGIEFISIREQFDTSSPMGRAMMYIASVFSQLERETIAERIRDNLYELAKTGRWLGGNTPTGYESGSVVSVNVDGKTKKAHMLKIIPYEKELINMIFNKFLETESLTKTDEYLLTNKFLTKNGKPFSRFAIKSILSNPVYMNADKDAYNYLTEKNISLFCDEELFNGEFGVMVYNRTLQRRGKAHQIKPMNEWIAAIGKHEGIISGAKWIRVQDLLERNKSKSYKKPRSSTALLSGLILCADCGAYMRPKISKRNNATGNPRYTYLCTTKERSKSSVCSIKNVNGNILDDAVVDIIKQLEEDKEELIKRLKSIRRRVITEKSDYENTVSDLQAKMFEEEQKITALTLSLTNVEGSVAKKYTLELIEKSHNQIQLLKEHLRAIESINEKIRLNDSDLDSVKNILLKFNVCFEKNSIEEKMATVKTFVRKVTWDGRTVHIYLFNCDDEDNLLFTARVETHV